MDEKQIQKQAKEILDKFAKALEKVDVDEETCIEREKFEREEIVSSDKSEKSKNAKDNYINFKKELLENAPKKDSNFVIAEKGGWKK